MDTLIDQDEERGARGHLQQSFKTLLKQTWKGGGLQSSLVYFSLERHFVAFDKEIFYPEKQSEK